MKAFWLSKTGSCGPGGLSFSFRAVTKFPSVDLFTCILHQPTLGWQFEGKCCVMSTDRFLQVSHSAWYVIGVHKYLSNWSMDGKHMLHALSHCLQTISYMWHSIKWKITQVICLLMYNYFYSPSSTIYKLYNHCKWWIPPSLILMGLTILVLLSLGREQMSY